MTDRLSKTEAMIAAKIAWQTADAYSADIWGAVRWVAAAQMLLQMDFSEAETRAILRSKLTRWARDAWVEEDTWLGQLSVLANGRRNEIKAGSLGVGEIGEHCK